MNKKWGKVFEIGCSGLVGVVLTIGYQHFFSQPQSQEQSQNIIVNIDGKEVLYQSEDVEALNEKISTLESDNNLLSEKIKNINSKNYKLVINGIEQAINNTNSVLDYEGKTYICEDIISLINSSFNIDKENEKLIIGKNLGETFLLMQVCPPHETNYGYYSANGDKKDGSNIFKMAGETYTNGFKVDINRSQGAQAIFNLKGEYNTLEFDLGHVDGTSRDKLYLKITIDNITEVIEAQADDFPKHHILKLNSAEKLIIDSIGESGSMWGSMYGLANIIVY